MKIPEMLGEVERRLIVSYRADPDVVAKLLPAPFRPQVVEGYAVLGFCLVRLGRLKLRGVPQWSGLRPEDAAHRIAMEWDSPAGVQTGVYIKRRDSNTLTNVLAGGCIYPGKHNRSRFKVVESPTDIRIYCRALDGSTEFDVHVREAETLSGSKSFHEIAEAAEFFGRGSANVDAELPNDGAAAWASVPATVLSAKSSYFDNPAFFPSGSIQPDCALIMRPIEGKTIPELRSESLDDGE